MVIDKKNVIPEWSRLSENDDDYIVILEAHKYGLKNVTADDIIIDKNNDFNALENIKKLGLIEKGYFNGNI